MGISSCKIIFAHARPAHFMCEAYFMLQSGISLAKRQISWKKARRSVLFSGDPDENRTRVTAVKGPCLNHLTTGPALMQKHQKRKRRIEVRLVGSGNWTRTSDTPGMNRMLYQLSYAAIEPPLKGQGLLYRKTAALSREN